jgi:hypothetical protein
MESCVLCSLDFELAAGELICEVNDFELSGIDIQDSAHEDVLELEGCVFTAFEEDALVLDIKLGGAGCTISMVRSFRK